jgi:hypothetical protein
MPRRLWLLLMSILVRLTSNHRKGDFSIGSTSEILNFSITAALASCLFAAGPLTGIVLTKFRMLSSHRAVENWNGTRGLVLLWA